MIKSENKIAIYIVPETKDVGEITQEEMDEHLTKGIESYCICLHAYFYQSTNGEIICSKCDKPLKPLGV